MPRQSVNYTRGGANHPGDTTHQPYAGVLPGWEL